jgi:signal transduction histidine kinase
VIDYTTLLTDIQTTACTLSDKSQQVAVETQGILTEQQVYIFQMVTNSAARFLTMIDGLAADYQAALTSQDSAKIAEQGAMAKATLLHDMRSPLTVIVSGILLLVDDEFEPAPLNEATKSSLREIQRIANQILQLMNL